MGLISRIFNKTPSKIRKIAAAEGFRQATPEETYGWATDLQQPVQSKNPSVDHLIAWATQAQAAIDAGTVLPWGVPASAVLGKWASNPPTLAFEERREDHVAPFREAYASHSSPLTAVMLAQACFDAASDARGTDWASNVSEKNWALYARWNQLGIDALNAQSQAGASDSGWLSHVYSSVARAPKDYTQLNDAFIQAFSADNTNLHLLREHGMYLLPRWFGNDERAIDEFANWATEATAEHFGEGAYAYIYGGCATEYGLLIGQTLCDPERLNQGYLDLRERFPSNRLLNEHTNAMCWADQQDVVAALFDCGLRAIDHLAWGGGNQAEGLENAIGSYLRAKESA